MKLSSIVISVAAAGLIAASPAIAQGLIRQTSTRASSSLPTNPAPPPPTNTTVVTNDPRQSPLLVVDSPG